MVRSDCHQFRKIVAGPTASAPVDSILSRNPGRFVSKLPRHRMEQSAGRRIEKFAPGSRPDASSRDVTTQLTSVWQSVESSHEVIRGLSPRESGRDPENRSTSSLSRVKEDLHSGPIRAPARIDQNVPADGPPWVTTMTRTPPTMSTTASAIGRAWPA
jgi:hypothetical protein